jgi:hypothetical protein
VSSLWLEIGAQRRHYNHLINGTASRLADVEKKMKDYFRRARFSSCAPALNGFNNANSRMRYRLKINRVKTHSLTHTLYG